MDAILEMRGITKEFPGVKALDNVNMTVRRGEIRALCGENGAGKSTLMKVLSGVYQPDGGTVTLDGQAVTLPSPKAARDLGIGIIHQEL